MQKPIVKLAFLNRTMKKITAIILSALLFVAGLAGCAEQDKPSAKNPVTLTMWHVYGSQTKSPLNDAVDEFNKTQDRIFVKYTSIPKVTIP